MTTVGTGEFTYEAILDWAKLPPGETFDTVSAVATDSQDRVYAFQRKDPPVMIFDRDGNLLDSWGNGNFEFSHGIHIAVNQRCNTGIASHNNLKVAINIHPRINQHLAWENMAAG